MLVAAGGINSLRAPDSGDITSTLSSFGAKTSFFLVLFRSIFGAGTSSFGAGNLVLENTYLVLDRGLSLT